MIRFFNTLFGKVEEFKPLKAGEVRMYTCGPTVYDYAHIGNFRAFVSEDLLRRFLEFKGFQVKHVMNITDVDDKTITGSAREKKELNDFTAAYIQAFREDLKTLNILPPNHPAEEPRATREIPAMLELIEKLIKKGAAYASDGSVYYRVSSFPNYGKLSKKKLEGNIKGARVDRDEYDKEEAADFVLWKKAKEGEPSWDSPWGEGRPGWHIECSAMSMKYLGETFDIHAGGEDLIFPHHENEIAQSEAATGKKLVNYWLHCKHLLVNGEKMSKSKGNFYTLRDLLAKGYDPMAIRYALISVHYRQQLNFTLEGLKEASESVRKLDEAYADCQSRYQILEKNFAFETDICKTNSEEPISYESRFKSYLNDMLIPLSEDLNISSALAMLFLHVNYINHKLASWSFNKEGLLQALKYFEEMDRLFGFDASKEKEIPSDILEIMKKRFEIRRQIKETNDKSLWEKSDKLRNEIQAKGWFVKDGKPSEFSAVKKKRRSWDK